MSVLLTSHKIAGSGSGVPPDPEPETINAPTGITAAAGSGVITIGHNAVAGAARYGTYRNTTNDPGTATLIDDVRVTTSYVDSDVSGTDPYYYWVDAVTSGGVRSGKSSGTSATLPQVGGDTAIVPGAMIVYDGFVSAGIEIPFTGDPLAEVEADLEYRIDGGDWLPALPAIRQQQRFGFEVVSVPATNQIEVTSTNALGPASTASRFVGWWLYILDPVTYEPIGAQRTITHASGGSPSILTVDQNWSVSPSVGDKFVIMNPATGNSILIQNLLNLPPGETIDVRCTLTHPDGVNGANPVVTTFQTRAENILTPAALYAEATRFVSATGDDTTGTGLVGAPWRTMDKAVEYIEAGDGTTPRIVGAIGKARYSPYELTITKPGAIVAEYIAFDDQQALDPATGMTHAYSTTMGEVNASNRSVLESSIVYGPSGANGTRNGTTAWVQETYDAVLDTGEEFTVWTLTLNTGDLVGAEVPQTLSYRSAFDDKAIDIPYHNTALSVKTWNGSQWAASGSINTEAAIAEFMAGNDMYNYGWCYSPSNPNKILVRIPLYAPTSDPRDLYMSIGKGSDGAGAMFNVSTTGTPTDGATFRLCGFQIQDQFKCVSGSPNSSYHVYDHNLVCATRWPFYAKMSLSPQVIPHHHVCEHNKFFQISLRAPVGEDPNPYTNRLFIKNNVNYVVGDTLWTAQRIADWQENYPYRGEGGSQNLVFRYNIVDGYFNGVNVYNKGDGTYPRQGAAGGEVYRNRFYNVADDCVEFEPHAQNLRVIENRAEYCGVLVTLAPGEWGPITVFRNEHWQGSVEEVNEANLDAGRSSVLGRKMTPIMFKVGIKQNPPSTVYAIHNTMWSNRGEVNPGWSLQNWGKPNDNVVRPRWWHLSNAGAPGTRPRSWHLNNIMRVSEDIMSTGTTPNTVSFVDNALQFVCDYNFMVNLDNATKYYTGTADQVITSITTYRSKFTPLDGEIAGVPSNVNNYFGGVSYAFNARGSLDAMLMDPTAGDLRVDPSSGADLVDAGYAVSNICPTPLDIGAGQLDFRS
jgi:hypothetical protein